MHPAGRLNSREGYSSYVSPGTYELRRFTGPIKRHVTSTVQLADQGTASNGPQLTQARLRHQGKSAEARTLPCAGSYWARPVSIFKLHLIIIIVILILSIT